MTNHDLSLAWRCVDQIAREAEKSDGLRLELQRQLQLLEWLVHEWHFDEIADARDQLKKQMASFEELTPRTKNHSEYLLSVKNDGKMLCILSTAVK